MVGLYTTSDTIVRFCQVLRKAYQLRYNSTNMIPGNPASTGERVESQPIETAATPTSAGPQGETVSQETASAAGEAVEKGDPTAALEALSAKPPEGTA